MGGNAFAQAVAREAPTLRTPRMTKAQYDAVKSRWIAKLQSYFGQETPVGCVVEAPEKSDYGDVDLFVTWNENTTPIDFVAMAKAIGAPAVIVHGRTKCTLGVLMDESALGVSQNEHKETVVYRARRDNVPHGTSPVTAEAYTQIDLGAIDPKLVPWCSFHSSYGDMVALLGQIVTHFRFRVTDHGIWLRLSEMDRAKDAGMNIPDKDGLVFLSHEPDDVMRFLGVSVEKYKGGFDTLEQLYEWLGQCRLLDTGAVQIKRHSESERNRRDKRPVYAGFFYDWLPAHRHMNDELSSEQRSVRLAALRASFAEEAIDHFHKRMEYETKRAALIMAVKNATASKLVRELVAKHTGKADTGVTEVMKAIRRRIGCAVDGKPYIRPNPNADCDSELHRFLTGDGVSLRNSEEMSDWVERNWEEVREAERRRAKGSRDAHS